MHIKTEVIFTPVFQNTVDLHLTYWPPEALESICFNHLVYPLLTPETLPEHQYVGHFFRRRFVKRESGNSSRGDMLKAMVLSHCLRMICNTQRLQILSNEFKQFFPEGVYFVLCQPVNYIEEFGIK